jgi:hypothetical protein
MSFLGDEPSTHFYPGEEQSTDGSSLPPTRANSKTGAHLGDTDYEWGDIKESAFIHGMREASKRESRIFGDRREGYLDMFNQVANKRDPGLEESHRLYIDRKPTMKPKVDPLRRKPTLREFYADEDAVVDRDHDADVWWRPVWYRDNHYDVHSAFMMYTTAHGFRNIFEDAHWMRRIFWAVFMSTAFVVWGYTSTVLINEYRSRPTTTEVIEDLRLPAIL